jgi:hypothetical protein
MYLLTAGDVSLTAQQDVTFFIYLRLMILLPRTQTPLASQPLSNVIQSVAKNLPLKNRTQQLPEKIYRSTAGDVSLNTQQDVFFFYLSAPDDPTFDAHRTIPNAHSSRTSFRA